MSESGTRTRKECVMTVAGGHASLAHENELKLTSNTRALSGANRLPSLGAACPLFPTARCQIIPGSWFSNARATCRIASVTSSGLS